MTDWEQMEKEVEAGVRCPTCKGKIKEFRPVMDRTHPPMNPKRYCQDGWHTSIAGDTR